MAKDSSFDVVSQVDMQEMDNAVNQVKKEIDQRYDFRGSNASIELGEKEVKIAAEDEYKLGAILDMLRQKWLNAVFLCVAWFRARLSPLPKAPFANLWKSNRVFPKRTAKNRGSYQSFQAEGNCSDSG